MTTPVLTSLRDAVADAVAGIDGLSIVAFGWVPGAGTKYPVAFLAHESDEQIGQSHTWVEVELTLYVVFGASMDRDVQERSDEAVSGASSISTALRADPTFGSTCIDSAVSGGTRPVYQELGGYNAIGRQWTIKALLAA